VCQFLVTCDDDPTADRVREPSFIATDVPINGDAAPWLEPRVRGG
jgi:hypothetical protein